MSDVCSQLKWPVALISSQLLNLVNIRNILLLLRLIWYINMGDILRTTTKQIDSKNKRLPQGKIQA